MARRDIRLKDDAGNYLFPLAHKDDDGNVIKRTYIKNTYNSQIVKSVVILYAFGNDPLEAPHDSAFVEDPAESSETGAYLWQALFTTYLDNSVIIGNKVNLTLHINGLDEI